MTDDPYECPYCEETHTDYTDEGTAASPPGHRGGYELVKCERCGETIEFGVL